MPSLMNRENIRSRGARYALANMQEPDTLINLAHRQEYSLTGDHRYQTIVCNSGSVWITQEGDYQDYLLHEGEVFIITQKGRVIVRALEDATIGLCSSLDQASQANRMSRHFFQ